MNPEDRLHKASHRVRMALGDIDVPAPPRPPRRSARALAFGFGMIAVIAIVGITGLIGRVLGPGEGDDVGDSTTTLTATDDDQIYRGTVTIIDTGDNPMVCAGGVAESYPPQCSGPVLEGLDWSEITWAETANGVTWADMTIDVRVDGDALLLAAAVEEPKPRGDDSVDFTPPCAPPEGGWVWTDGPLTAPEDMDRAANYARTQPDSSAVWVYNLLENPEEGDLTGRQEYVLVALFTGNLATHETELRALWGGPLCVAERNTKASDLNAIQQEVTDQALAGEIPGLVGFGYSYTEELKGEVVLGSLIVMPVAESWLAENYGDMPLRFESQLIPVGRP